MGLSDRLFNRQRTVHQILGGGLVADVMLWRQKNLTMGILVITLAAWVVFERSGYTLLSLTSSVLLLLFTILFLWAKSAAILNRPSPPLPHLYLSEETVNEAAAFIRDRLNGILSIAEDVAMGRDSKTFIKIASSLFLISIIGSLTDFLTLAYTGLVIIFTVPAIYERYEDDIDKYLIKVFLRLEKVCMRLKVEVVDKVQKWILEQKKLN